MQYIIFLLPIFAKRIKELVFGGIFNFFAMDIYI